MSIEHCNFEVSYCNYVKRSDLCTYSEITKCCGSVLLDYRNIVSISRHNPGITVFMSEDKALDCPQETNEYWIESVVLEEGHTMHIKHRKEFYDEDYEDED